MNSRIVTDESTGRNVDEYLEVIFRQVFEWDVAGKQGPAIEQLLDQYTSRIYGSAAVPTVGIISNEDKALLWVSQFGQLQINAVSDKLVKSLRKSNPAFKVPINYSAKIGPERDNQKHVYGRSVHQVTLLAGVQVLRETADETLNKVSTQRHH